MPTDARRVGGAPAAAGRTLAAMAEACVDPIPFDDTVEETVHRSIQDVWRAQNAAWRTKVLSELRRGVPAQRDDSPRTA